MLTTTISSDRPFGSTTSSHVLEALPVPPPPNFSSFQFMTIGREPELLKRISSARVEGIYEGADWPDRSPLLLPDEQNHLAEGSPRTAGSSRSRPSLFEALGGGGDINMYSPEEEEQIHGEASLSSSNLTSTVTAIRIAPNHSVSRGIDTHSSSTFVSIQEPHIQASGSFYSRLSSPQPTDATTVANSWPVGNPLSSSVTHSPQQASEALATCLSSLPNEEESNLMNIQALQAKLYETLANLNPIDTSRALQSAQSIEERCRDVLGTARRAHMLAQQALAVAKESMDVAQVSLTAAESLQPDIHEVVDAVQKVGSGLSDNCGQAWQWNKSIESLKDGLHRLGQWAIEREVQHAKRQQEAKERETESRKKDFALPLELHTSRSLAMRSTSAGSILPSQPPHTAFLPPKTTPALSVEDEANAAKNAWNLIHDKANERKEVAKEQLRKRREAEELLEQQQQKAQEEAATRDAELTKLRAERLKAEEEEAARQREEAKEMEMRRKELERVQAEASQFQRSQQREREELNLKLVEEKARALQAEKEKEIRMVAEERVRREKYEESERFRLEKAKAARKEANTRLQEGEQRRQIREKQRTQPSVTQAERVPISATTSIKNIPLSSRMQAGSHNADRSMTDGNDRSEGTTKHFVSIPLSTRDATSTAAKLAQPTVGLPSRSRSMNLHPQRSIDNPPNAAVDILDKPNYPVYSQSQSPMNQSHSSSPSTPPRQATREVRDEISTNCMGPDMGNIPVSQPTPISPEAQKANLRRLKSTNGAAATAFIKLEREEQKAVIKTESDVVAPKTRPTSWVSKDTAMATPGIKIGPPKSTPKKPKSEIPTDIPLLSAPTPPPSSPKTLVIPNSAEQRLAHPPKAQTYIDTGGDYPPLGTAAPRSSLSNISTTAHIPSNSAQEGPPSARRLFSDVPREDVLNSSSLPPPLSVPKAPPKAKATQPVIASVNANSDSSSQMCPDVATIGSWSQRNALQEDESRHHYSPSPLPVSHLGPSRSQKQPSKVDHWSPPRRAEPVYSGRNSPDHSRKRTSGSRGASPYTTPRPLGDLRSLSQEVVALPIAGRKRTREETQLVAPPPRRYRRGEQEESRSSDYSSFNNPHEEWSRATPYGRSSSPEARSTPLALRLEQVQDTTARNSTQNSYRPPAASNHYRPDHNWPINQAENSYYPNSQQRSITRTENQDQRPDLLSRFTDSAAFPSTPTVLLNYYQTSRPSRGRPAGRSVGRGGGPIEQRLASKSQPLIDRLQNA